jgi:hypothetical protein
VALFAVVPPPLNNKTPTETVRAEKMGLYMRHL